MCENGFVKSPVKGGGGGDYNYDQLLLKAEACWIFNQRAVSSDGLYDGLYFSCSL